MMSTCLHSILLVPMFLLTASCQVETYPGEHWQTMTPEEAGLDAPTLDRMRDFMQGRGCIVRHGRMVYEWGNIAERGDVASAVKPWFSFFLFKAIEEGRLPGVDTKAIGFVPCLESLNPDLGFKDREIAFRHFATQTSCYGVREAPGTAFDYNDFQMALFMDTLFLGVYGVTYATVDETVLHAMLTDVLQCEDDPTFMAFGMDGRPGRLGVSPRDFCRFGYLFLHEGQWRGKQILTREDAHRLVGEPLPASLPRTKGEAAELCSDQRSLGSERIPDNQCDHVGSYSWLWWINGVSREGKRHWPDAPADIYAALGHRNGMRGMAVIPSLDIVMSWNDTVIGDMDEDPEPLNTAFRLLREAVRPESMPGQVVVDPRHREWLGRNMDREGACAPFALCAPGDPEGFLYRGTRKPDGTRDGDQQAILDTMKGTGANCLYVEAIRSHGGDGGATENPFVDSDPAKGLDERILAQWETWFRFMDENGIVVFFIVYDDSARIWDTADGVGPEEQAFLERIVRRFEHHRNWIWGVAEEYEESFSPARVSAIASILRNADNHRHAIAVHKTNGLDFDEFADDPNIDVFAAQWNVVTPEALHDGMLEAWRKARGRYAVVMAEAKDFGFGDAARDKLWACAMAGAGAMALGWSFDHPGEPSRGDLEACGHLARCFESSHVNEMAPHDELAAGASTYVLAAPGVSYLAYAAEGKGPLGLKAIPEGTYSLTWFSVTTGKSATREHVRVSQGEPQWKRPRGLDGAVALYLRAEAAPIRAGAPARLSVERLK